MRRFLYLTVFGGVLFFSPLATRHSLTLRGFFEGPLLYAQSTSASLTGRVLDPSKAVVVGADVVAINLDTNARYGGRTNQSGIYYIANLSPGTYRIEVNKTSFKTDIQTGIELHLQETVEINFDMTLGSASETVTVKGGGININTTDGTVSTLVDAKTIENMPLNGRSFQDLILLTPGVVTGSPQTSGPNGSVPQKGEFSVNGQRTEENYYTVDGVSANVGATPVQFLMTQGPAASGSVAASTALGTTQALVSVDDLQEFRVQSSTYSAEFGRNPGGQFAFETKSGTNQWHGTAFDYLRNGAFDALDYFTNYYKATQPALRQNDFGGTLGGPIRIPHVYNGKDKTFFFVSYEGLRLTQPQAAQLFFVPDLCMRGAPGACTGAEAGRAAASSALLHVVDAFPVPTAEVDPVNGVGSFSGGWSNPGSLNSTSIRLDQVVNDKMTLFFRFSDTNSNSQSRSGPVVVNQVPFTSRTYTLGADYTFSSRVSDDFRLNYSSDQAIPGTAITAFGGNTPVNLAMLTGLGPNAFPEVLFVLGTSVLNVNQGTQINEQRQWNLIDTVSYSMGAHQFKFGLDYRRLTPFQVPSNPLAEYVYVSEPSIESGQYLEAVVAPYAPDYPKYINFSAFAQDDWKASHRLTLSIGLRWEVNPAPGVTQGVLPYTFVPTSNPNNWALAPEGTPLWKTTWFNFAPRVGAAYLIRDTPGWQTVVRGGGGVFFDTGQQLGSLGFTGPGYSVTGLLPSGGPTDVFPNSPATQIPKITNPPVGFQYAIFGFDPHLQLPYTLQWNASIQQALGRSQAVTVSYVGSHGARLLQQNQFMPSANPNAFMFRLVQNGLTSDYNALQVQFQRSLARGLTVLGSYTWSHCIDYGSVNFLIQYQRGNCDFDVRQNLSAAFSYTLPNVGQNQLARVILDHWGVDDRLTARTSFPVFLPGNSTFNPITGQEMPSGEDIVPSQPLYLYGSSCASFYRGIGILTSTQVCPGGRSINPCAFYPIGGPANPGCPTTPTLGGMAPRNVTRGFGAVQMDMAVRREFPIHENLKLQFRAEAFNLFNHANFGSVSVTGPNFGLSTATLANSLGVLSPQYQMGGPRSMQFALKLIF